MSLAIGQPRVRFAEHFNPGNISALAYVPKTIAIEKTITATVTQNVWAAPAGVFVSRVVAVCQLQSASTDATFVFGVDGDTNAFINETDFDISTTGNWATNIGSAAAPGAKGMYLAAGDNLALQVAGTTVTNGQVRVIVEYYELAEMFKSGGIHIQL